MRNNLRRATVITLFIMTIFLCSCGTFTLPGVSGDYEPVNDPEVLIDRNKNVFTGTIEDVSFGFYDKDMNEVKHIDLLTYNAYCHFYTIYDVKVESVLKGEIETDTVRVAVLGGHADQKKDEQLKIINRAAKTFFSDISIPPAEGSPLMYEGREYLIMSKKCLNGIEMLSDPQGCFEKNGKPDEGGLSYEDILKIVSAK